MKIEDTTIAVALDDSEPSLRAAGFAASLSRSTGRPLQLVHVFEGRPEELVDLDNLPDDIQAVIHLSDEEVAQARERTGRRIFDRARAEPGVADCGPGEVLLSGDPAAEMLGWLERHPDTLLVVGRRGLSRIRGLITGSVSDRLVHHAPGPVLVVD